MPIIGWLHHADHALAPIWRSVTPRRSSAIWRLSRSGRYDLRRLKEVMLLLIANDSPLGPEWLDHPLKGQWADHRECHVGGDFLLIYRIDAEALIFVRAGTHADLFDE